MNIDTTQWVPQIVLANRLNIARSLLGYYVRIGACKSITPPEWGNTVLVDANFQYPRPEPMPRKKRVTKQKQQP